MKARYIEAPLNLSPRAIRLRDLQWVYCVAGVYLWVIKHYALAQVADALIEGNDGQVGDLAARYVDLARRMTWLTEGHPHPHLDRLTASERAKLTDACFGELRIRGPVP